MKKRYTWVVFTCSSIQGRKLIFINLARETTFLPFIFRTNIWKLISTNLCKVTPKKEPTYRMLDPTTHFNEVFKNILRRSLF